MKQSHDRRFKAAVHVVTGFPCRHTTNCLVPHRALLHVESLPHRTPLYARHCEPVAGIGCLGGSEGYVVSTQRRMQRSSEVPLRLMTSNTGAVYHSDCLCAASDSTQANRTYRLQFTAGQPDGTADAVAAHGRDFADLDAPLPERILYAAFTSGGRSVATRAQLSLVCKCAPTRRPISVVSTYRSSAHQPRCCTTCSALGCRRRLYLSERHVMCALVFALVTLYIPRSSSSYYTCIAGTRARPSLPGWCPRRGHDLISCLLPMAFTSRCLRPC